MNNKFDELAKSLAQSTTRRAAIKQFGLAIAGIALASLGLANNAEADSGNQPVTYDPRGPRFHCRCKEPEYGCDLQSPNSTLCLEMCRAKCGP